MQSFAWCAGPAAMAAMMPVDAAPAAPSPTVAPSRRIEPASPGADCLRQAQGALAAGQLDVALGWFRHAAAVDPELHLARLGAALCLVQMGREQEGAAELAGAYQQSARPGEVDVALARLYMLAGQTQSACTAVGLAIEQDHGWAARVRDDPAFQRMRDHPHFLQVVGDL